MTNPTIASVEHCSTVANNFGHVRYMAPEFLNALSYKLANSGPTEESDIYSFAMTAYHVRLPRAVCGHRWHCNIVARFSQGFCRMELILSGRSFFVSFAAIDRPALRIRNG